jgi:hypothetical protein
MVGSTEAEEGGGCEVVINADTANALGLTIPP